MALLRLPRFRGFVLFCFHTFPLIWHLRWWNPFYFLVMFQSSFSSAFPPIASCNWVLSIKVMNIPHSFCVLFLLTNKSKLFFLFVFLFSVPTASTSYKAVIWISRCFSNLPTLCSYQQKFLICYWIKLLFSNLSEVSFTSLSLTILKVLLVYTLLIFNGHLFKDLCCTTLRFPSAHLTGGLLFSKPVLFFPVK